MIFLRHEKPSVALYCSLELNVRQSQKESERERSREFAHESYRYHNSTQVSRMRFSFSYTLHKLLVLFLVAYTFRYFLSFPIFFSVIFFITLYILSISAWLPLSRSFFLFSCTASSSHLVRATEKEAHNGFPSWRPQQLFYLSSNTHTNPSK